MTNLAPDITASRTSPVFSQALRIDRIAAREIRMPLREPFASSSGTVTDKRVLLVEVTDADGASAWGECGALATPHYLPETVDTAWLALSDYLASMVLGHRFAGPQHLHGHLEQGIRGHHMAKACVEMAAWTLAAEKCGVSLASALGGTRDKVATGIALGLEDSVEALVAKAKAAVAEGYPRIKIKIAPGRDVDYARAVCKAVGDKAQVMVDANNAYTLNDTDHLLQLDDLGLSMVEQPLAWDDVAQHAELQAHMTTPICLDESITNVDRARDMIGLKSGRIINIKPSRVGGFTQALAIHDLCAEHDIPVWCGGMLETGIGRACNVALASLPNFSLPGDLSPSSRYWERDIVTPEWTMDGDGMVTVPEEKPGQGVEIDRGYIESLTVRREEFTQE